MAVYTMCKKTFDLVEDGFPKKMMKKTMKKMIQKTKRKETMKCTREEYEKGYLEENKRRVRKRKRRSRRTRRQRKIRETGTVLAIEKHCLGVITPRHERRGWDLYIHEDHAYIQLCISSMKLRQLCLSPSLKLSWSSFLSQKLL